MTCAVWAAASCQAHKPPASRASAGGGCRLPTSRGQNSKSMRPERQLQNKRQGLVSSAGKDAGAQVQADHERVVAEYQLLREKDVPWGCCCAACVLARLQSRARQVRQACAARSRARRQALPLALPALAAGWGGAPQAPAPNEGRWRRADALGPLELKRQHPARDFVQSPRW